MSETEFTWVVYTGESALSVSFPSYTMTCISAVSCGILKLTGIVAFSFIFTSEKSPVNVWLSSIIPLSSYAATVICAFEISASLIIPTPVTASPSRLMPDV